jgi:hypothetical protein
MRYYDTSPDSAETYFNHSIFGQLYTLIAETLGSSERRRPTHERLQDATVPSNPDAPRRTLLDRLDTWLWRQAQNDREAYLARSRDIFELERRMEALERGTITRYY